LRIERMRNLLRFNSMDRRRGEIYFEKAKIHWVFLQIYKPTGQPR
jgi:hypothetical protein